MEDLANGVANMNLGNDLVEMIVAPKASKYDGATEELQANFKNVDMKSISSLKFSANSYGADACKWI